mgnify:CR=1 FL=1
MFEIFSKPGALATVPISNGMPAYFALDGWGNSGFKAILTSASIKYGVNVQFQHSLDQFIYVYIFGRRMGEFNVSGITFADTCTSSIVGYHGADVVQAYWDIFNTVQYGKPITAVFGTTPFILFLVGMQQSLAEPEFGIGRFSLNFAVMP